MLTGKFGVVSATDSRRERHPVDVSGAIISDDRIRVDCSKWPSKFKSEGKPPLIWNRVGPGPVQQPRRRGP